MLKKQNPLLLVALLPLLTATNGLLARTAQTREAFCLAAPDNASDFLKALRGIIWEAGEYVVRADDYTQHFTDPNYIDPATKQKALLPTFIKEIRDELKIFDSMIDDFATARNRGGSKADCAEEIVEKTEEIIKRLRSSLVELHNALVEGWKKKSGMATPLSLGMKLQKLEAKINSHIMTIIPKLNRISTCITKMGDANLADRIMGIKETLAKSLKKRKPLGIGTGLKVMRIRLGQTQ